MWDRSDPANFKRSVVAAFDRTGRDYGIKGDSHWQHAHRLVELARLHAGLGEVGEEGKGQHVLDVATGTAPAAIMAAQIVGTAGRVVGTDISPHMLSLAHDNVAASGLTNIELQLGDAENLDFRDESFDVVLCSSAVPWFSNIPQALEEFYRVLVRGGRLVFSCWGGEYRAAIVNLMASLWNPYGYTIPELNEALNTPEKCLRLVLESGFQKVVVVIDDVSTSTPDAEKSFQEVWSGSVSRFNLATTYVDAEQMKAIYMKEYQELMRQRRGWAMDYVQFVLATK